MSRLMVSARLLGMTFGVCWFSFYYYIYNKKEKGSLHDSLHSSQFSKDMHDRHLRTDRPVRHTVNVRLVVSNASCITLPLDRDQETTGGCREP